MNKLSREAKWQYYLEKDNTFGKQIFACMHAKNPQWPTNEFGKRLSSAYSTASDRVHVTSHELKDKLDHREAAQVEIVEAARNIQILNVLECIGDTFKIQIKRV